MNIGIIVAMEKELMLLLPLMENTTTSVIDSVTFYSGSIKGNSVVAMQCGIGKVNAAIGTLTLINNYNPQLIINTGVAGAASASVNVMDVVVGEKIAYHDVWCGPGTEYGEASGFPLYFCSDSDIISLLPTRRDIQLGLICSGDKFIASIDEINAIRSHFPDAIAVDMESATIAQVCFLRKTPFLSLRVISDSPCASHNNISQYDNFWESAPRHTFALLQELLSKLTTK